MVGRRCSRHAPSARFALPAVLTLALALTGREARANGRFPETNAIFFAPKDPNTVLLRTTFGLLVSRDHAKSWDWVCERSIGLAGVEDPMFAVTPDGTLISSSFQGLATSRDRACNWGFIGGALKELVFIDLTARPSTPGNVIAFSSSYAGQDDAGAIFFRSTLFETTDEGKTFSALAGAIDPTLLGQTVDVTASDPDRIYVSAVRNPGAAVRAVLLSSRDHGAKFVETSIPLLGSERAAFIAAVDPTSADRVYVRTSNAVDKPSRLLVTDDAGATFRTVFTGKGPLAGFALSPDGKRIYVGGPSDGLHVASTVDFDFQKKSPLEVGCLALNDDGLWACSNEKSGFVVGLSVDDGATFQSKLQFCDVRGPLACAPGTTTNTQCSLGGTTATATPPWPPQRALLGCGGQDGGGPAPPHADPDRPTGGSGCGCLLGGPSPAPFAALVAGAGGTLVLLRRRRSRRR